MNPFTLSFFVKDVIFINVVGGMMEILLGLSVNAHTQTAIRVPSEFPTIQEAIDASLDGDTIREAPGTFVENI